MLDSVLESPIGTTLSTSQSPGESGGQARGEVAAVNLLGEKETFYEHGKRRRRTKMQSKIFYETSAREYKMPLANSAAKQTAFSETILHMMSALFLCIL